MIATHPTDEEITTFVIDCEHGRQLAERIAAHLADTYGVGPEQLDREHLESAWINTSRLRQICLALNLPTEME